MRSTSTGAMPIDGSSSSSSFGFAISARPIASICCSPPDIVPALALALLEPREQLVDALAVGAHAVVTAQVRAQVEVLAHGHAREAVAPLGRQRHAEAND